MVIMEFHYNPAALLMSRPLTPEIDEQLQFQAQRLRSMRIADVVDDNSRLFRQEVAGLCVDASKHLIDAEAASALLSLAKACNFDAWRAALQNGDAVNHTEQRAALHSLLRSPQAPAGQDAAWHDVQAARAQLARWVEQLQAGEWRGFTGKAITDVVNLGIGGSDLGPAFVVEALRDYHHSTIRTHFVANIDANQLMGVLAKLDPASTLFVMTSKSFTTQETLVNAATARQWLADAGASERDLSAHFVAITSQPARAQQWGIDPSRTLPFWDWVGGRFSLWSAVGFPIAAATSSEVFDRLLAGAHAMDQHFFLSPVDENLPLRLALLDYWYTRFFDAHSQVVLPYSHLLRRLPDFLQQMIMESNGKSVQRNGLPVEAPTSAVIWGSEGTNGQHSFHQLLHQGTRLIPAEFILPLRSAHEPGEHQSLLVANCLAQARTLMLGRPREEVLQELRDKGLPEAEACALAPHIEMPGNRPSTLILMDRLTPETLGALIALYEHRVFAQSVLWNINPFDQWGVELGKRVANDIHNYLIQDGDTAGLDHSTRFAVERFRRAKG